MFYKQISFNLCLVSASDILKIVLSIVDKGNIDRGVSYKYRILYFFYNINMKCLHMFTFLNKSTGIMNQNYLLPNEIFVLQIQEVSSKIILER